MKNKYQAAEQFAAKWYSGNGHDGKHYWLTPPKEENQTQLLFEEDNA